MNLNVLFHKFMDEYANEYSKAWKELNFKRPFAKLVMKDIPDCIKAHVDISIYSVKGGVGSGRWTSVPWIALFDDRITKSAQKGIYIVYLLNKESKTLYLTLNQGTTEVKKNKSDSNKILKDRAIKLRALLLENHNDEFSDKINSGRKDYDSGCIFSKKYTLDTLPSDDVLVADLKEFIQVYYKYYLSTLEGNLTDTNGNSMTGVDKMIVSVKEQINRIREYITSKGFTYKDSLVKNFYLSLKTKPFVILAGTSGTGKTRLVKLFAEAIGAKYTLISVRPDWSDGSDLFGHTDINGNFVKGAICDSFDYAMEHPEKPVFVCLDEMNLARVEYYLSDFLSIIESREMQKNERIVTDSIAQYKDGIPDNVYFIGTVNMDETTFPFSKKVLDRANTVEFNCVNLIPSFENTERNVEQLDATNDFLRSKYLVLNIDCATEKEYVEEICIKLEAINRILYKANEHIGYRVRDEIVFYMLNNKNADNILEENDAFDNEIIQKILPRIQGSSVAIRDMLIQLYRFCGNNASDLDEENRNIGNYMQAHAYESIYPLSATKIGYMMTRYEEDGFTSFWL